MPHHHVTDFDKPDRLKPPQRAQVLAEARARIRQLPTDTDGNLHVSDVLAALDEDSA